MTAPRWAWACRSAPGCCLDGAGDGTLGGGSRAGSLRVRLSGGFDGSHRIWGDLCALPMQPAVRETRPSFREGGTEATARQTPLAAGCFVAPERSQRPKPSTTVWNSRSDAGGVLWLPGHCRTWGPGARLFGDQREQWAHCWSPPGFPAGRGGGHGLDAPPSHPRSFPGSTRPGHLSR